MRPSNGLVLASLNGAKQAEFQALLAPHKIPLAPFEAFVRNSSFLSHVESMAPAATYYENAFHKCHAAFQACKLPTFADDSGIEVDALNGAPGVHSAHYGKPNARESQDAANRRQLLASIKGPRTARMRCVLVFMVEGVVIRAEGVCEGKIAEKETGNGGFGYDPIFIPDAGGGVKTFAEMSTEEKNKISHRALAVNELVKLMHEREIQLVRP
ncbi:MAG: non-canonical purine NTP pyrophosphatase [Bdellovibrionota bacterium]